MIYMQYTRATVRYRYNKCPFLIQFFYIEIIGIRTIQLWDPPLSNIAIKGEPVLFYVFFGANNPKFSCSESI